MSHSHLGKKQFLEKAFLAFEEAGKEIAKRPRKKPRPPMSRVEQFVQARDYATENPSITHEEAAHLVESGEQPPEITDPNVKALYNAWREIDHDLLKRDRITSTNKPQRTPEEFVKSYGGDERELTLSRIHSVITNLEIDGKVALQMSNIYSSMVVYNQAPLNVMNEILDNPDILCEQAAFFARVNDMQRRVTLQTLHEKGTLFRPIPFYAPLVRCTIGPVRKALESIKHARLKRKYLFL